jgi:hypothetical protein
MPIDLAGILPELETSGGWFLSAEFADEIGSWQGWHAAITLLTPSAKNSLALQQVLSSTLG